MAGAKVFVSNIELFQCNFSGRRNIGVTCAMKRAELYHYLFALQGYLKVTVMVLGPGDEAPVS